VRRDVAGPALGNGGFRLVSRSAGIESGDNSPHSTIPPVLEQAAFHRAPAWNRQDYGVRRDVAALASPRGGETGPTPRSARRPLRMWAKVRGWASVLRRHKAATKGEPSGRILNIQHSILNVQVRLSRLWLLSYLVIEDWVLSIGYWTFGVPTHVRKTRTSHDGRVYRPYRSYRLPSRPQEHTTDLLEESNGLHSCEL